MAVLIMTAVVKYFEVADFLAAAARYNDRRDELGLPRYRFLGSAGGGTVNEVIALAEFDSIEAIDAADEVLSGAADVLDVLKEMYAHIVPGTVTERRFDALG
jgi:hypothetical protein